MLMAILEGCSQYTGVKISSMCPMAEFGEAINQPGHLRGDSDAVFPQHDGLVDAKLSMHLKVRAPRSGLPALSLDSFSELHWYKAGVRQE